MAIKNTVYIDFDLPTSIVDSVFDCHLPGVKGRVMNTVCFIKGSASKYIIS